MSSSKQILVVDDDPDMVEQISTILSHAGFTVTTASSRAEGAEALLHGAPDLAIVDLMMETPDAGFVLAHQVKKLHPQTPVVILTSVAAQTNIRFDLQSTQARSWVKADRIMDKPVRPEQLVAEVCRLLKLPLTTPHPEH